MKKPTPHIPLKPAGMLAFWDALTLAELTLNLADGMVSPSKMRNIRAKLEAAREALAKRV